MRDYEAEAAAERQSHRDSLRSADLELISVARTEGALRLHIAELLDGLFVQGGYHELGFSSFEAYVVERCQRSGSWGRDGRRLARRIREKGLVLLRSALRRGEVGISVAELIARHATAETEAEIIARAKATTYRELYTTLTGRAEAGPEPDEDPLVARGYSVRAEEIAALTASRMLVDFLSGRRVSDEGFVEALVGEGQSALLSIAEKVGKSDLDVPFIEPTREERLDRALATLDARGLPARPASGDVTVGAAAYLAKSAGQDASLASDGDRRTFAGAVVEALELDLAPTAATRVATKADRSGAVRDRRTSAGADLPGEEEQAPLAMTPGGLDAALVEACRELAARNLRMGDLARRVRSGAVWRDLGFRTFGEYAEGRVGLSLSTLEHLILLSRRLDGAPALRDAVAQGEVGYDAALRLTRVLGDSPHPELVEAWIDRARRRTVKHLREEVHAVVLGRTYSSAVSPYPPSEEDLEAVNDFERRVQTGEVVRPYVLAGVRAPQTSVTLTAVEGPGSARRPEAPTSAGGVVADGLTEPARTASDDDDDDDRTAAPQTSVGLREDESAPSVVAGERRAIRWRLSVELHSYLRRVAEEYHRVVGPTDVPFFSFLCSELWMTWRPFLEVWDDKWKDIYHRDRTRCTSPVCERHDVTLHHLRYRSHGGDDRPENLTSLCPACHLEGIHRGRLRAKGPSPNIDWSIGREPILEVHGREKIYLTRSR